MRSKTFKCTENIISVEFCFGIYLNIFLLVSISIINGIRGGFELVRVWKSAAQKSVGLVLMRVDSILCSW